VPEAAAELRALADECTAVMQRPASTSPGIEATALDRKTDALVRMAALIAQGGSPACYETTIAAALAAGATPDEVVDTLVAVAATVGLARVVSATPAVACALGYDVDVAFEAPRPTDPD
jgi:alkylhydroperoxidase/carboxymuconolactone decarboxylase family protein YurZ